jgi:hypothetical protein
MRRNAASSAEEIGVCKDFDGVSSGSIFPNAIGTFDAPRARGGYEAGEVESFDPNGYALERIEQDGKEVVQRLLGIAGLISSYWAVGHVFQLHGSSHNREDLKYLRWALTGLRFMIGGSLAAVLLRILVRVNAANSRGSAWRFGTFAIWALFCAAICTLAWQHSPSFHHHHQKSQGRAPLSSFFSLLSSEDAAAASGGSGRGGKRAGAARDAEERKILSWDDEVKLRRHLLQGEQKAHECQQRERAGALQLANALAELRGKTQELSILQLQYAARVKEASASRPARQASETDIGICMHVCMFAYIHAFMHACMHVCMCIYIYVYTYIHTHTHKFIHTYTYIYVHIYIYI